MPSSRSERLRPPGRGKRSVDAVGRHAHRANAVTGPRTAGDASGSYLSVVIPAKNEAASLARLVDEITRALRPLCLLGAGDLDGFEIVVVDDASTDQTRSVMEELMVAYPELRALALAASAGQSAAIMAGIHAARGDWIATLDADLQNDPADLVRLWRALPGPASAVLGWRVKRQDVWSKRIISYWANRLRNTVLAESIRDTGCSVRIFPRGLALRLPIFDGMHRFLGSLLVREGCRLVQVPVHHRPRFHGRSHYNFWNRSFRVAIDLIGVAWLMNRRLRCQAIETWGSAALSREAEPRVMFRPRPARAWRSQEG